ncbi:MAG TPA: PEP-CTERM sorting domain-containing protein [Desulfomonilia bacterium]
MKDCLFKILLVLALALPVSVQVYAAPFHYSDIYGQYDINISTTEPYIAFDGRADTENTYVIYGQTAALPDGNRPITSAPVPEPMTLVLFGIGMIGIGFLARKGTI